MEQAAYFAQFVAAPVVIKNYSVAGLQVRDGAGNLLGAAPVVSVESTDPATVLVVPDGDPSTGQLVFAREGSAVLIVTLHVAGTNVSKAVQRTVVVSSD